MVPQHCAKSMTFIKLLINLANVPILIFSCYYMYISNIMSAGAFSSIIETAL